MPIDELNYWIAYFEINYEREKKALEKAKRESKQNNNTRRMPYRGR